LYALSTLARHSEITVLRASGLATRDLLMTLFRVAALLALLTILVGEGLVPFSERMAQEMRPGLEQGHCPGIRNPACGSRMDVISSTSARQRPMPGCMVCESTSSTCANALESVTDVEEAHVRPPDNWLLKGVVRTVLEGETSRVERAETIGMAFCRQPRIACGPDGFAGAHVLVGLLNYTAASCPTIAKRRSATKSRSGKN
jgi:lipopolysaccharide export system permease protein